jgi:D-alanine-D-alanine ligase
MQALKEEGFDPVEVDPGEDLMAQLRAAKPDAVFNALHGRFGEDGTVQGILEWMRLPYTHSGVLSSALAMHKERTKDIYRAAGLPVVKSIVCDRKDAGARHMMEPPYVVKPVNEGSSVGIFIIVQGRQPPARRLGVGRLVDLQRDDGGRIRAGPRTDRQRDGRQSIRQRESALRHRDHHRPGFL